MNSNPHSSECGVAVDNYFKVSILKKRLMGQDFLTKQKILQIKELKQKRKRS
jgi:hypothetical protein